MNNRDIEKLKNEFDKTRLTPAEKASIRSELSHFIGAHAAPQSFSYPHTISYFVSYIGRPQVYAALGLLFVVGGSASASVLAQGALPGDLLYGMKVQINEQVESALALSEEAKIAVDTSQATRRLDEVQALKESGRLTSEIQTTLQTRFSEKMEAVDKNLIAVAARGDASAATKLQDSVEKDLDLRFESLAALTAQSQDFVAATGTTTHSKPRPLSKSVSAVLKRHEKRESEEDGGRFKKEDHKRGIDEAQVFEGKSEISASTTIQARTENLLGRESSSAEVEIHASSTKYEEREGVWNQIEDLFRKRNTRSKDQ